MTRSYGKLSEYVAEVINARVYDACITVPQAKLAQPWAARLGSTLWKIILSQSAQIDRSALEMKTAKHIGVTILSNVLARADRVIR